MKHLLFSYDLNKIKKHLFKVNGLVSTCFQISNIVQYPHEGKKKSQKYSCRKLARPNESQTNIKQV